jgi:hypothetical protein
MSEHESQPSLRRNFTIVIGALCLVMVLLAVLATTLANSVNAAG